MKKYIDSQKNIKLFTITIATYILFYFILNPDSLRYYFHNSLGKLLLLLFVVNITMVNPIFAAVFSFIIIGLYNSLIFTLEGMHNIPIHNEKKALLEGFDLKPAFYGTERNKIITMENYMRPKSSNTLIIQKYEDKKEPQAFFSFSL